MKKYIILTIILLGSLYLIISEKKHNNYVEVYYRDKQMKKMTLAEYFKLQYDSQLLYKIVDAENNDRVSYVIEDTGHIVIVWYDENMEVAKWLKLKMK